MTTEHELTFDEYGYLHRMKTPNGRDVAIMPLMFTWAIIADIDPMGYGDRWCYHTLQDALSALRDWDGTGEPSGWHRHPNSGRRVDENGEIYICT